MLLDLVVDLVCCVYFLFLNHTYVASVILQSDRQAHLPE
jgi:hypothetical protein